MMFSIVIPVYNVAPYLRECLDSLLAQTCADWEAVCVDDGSTDSSGAILDEYAAKDGRFRVFNKTNGGVSSARNSGLSQTQGEYVWFIDGDDVISNEAFATIVDAIEENGRPDIVQFALKRFSGEPCLGALSCGDGHIEQYDLTRTAELRRAYKMRAQWLLGSSGVYRRDVFGQDRFEPFRNSEDSLWGRRAFYKARSLVYIDRALYGYRQREGGANGDWSKRRWREFCHVSWIMTKEGVRVKGLFWPVLMAGLRSVAHAWSFRKRIVD